MTLLHALVLLPALGALGAAVHRTEAYRTGWLLVIAALHLVLTGLAWTGAPPPTLGGWIALDAIGLIVLTVVSVLFAAVAVYAVGYLRRENPRGGRAFVSCLLAFLSAASLVALSHHFALLWIGLEATTLAVAPLIFHRHDRRSLEAVWKYLMLSSVGIALALLGTFLLAASQSVSGDAVRPLVLEDLMAGAPQLHPAWLKAACVFLLVGYGTKMGLVPLHAWKPDTYAVAPGLVAGLMAGVLTMIAFLGLTRITQVMIAAGLGGFVTPLLLTFGLASLAVGAAFIIGQSDLKRMLAYSSVEHMGLLTLGLGLGGGSAYGALLHAVNNGLAKGLLFLTAGNVVLAAGGVAGDQRGLLRRAPASAILLLAGLLAVAGSPPFGTFLSEFTIVRGAFGAGHPWIGAAALLCLAVAFVGMARLIVPMVYGTSAEPGGREARGGENAWLVAGPVALALGVLLLGLFVPPALQRQLAAAAAVLGGRAP
jgi:hydrogenase-4 component F